MKKLTRNILTGTLLTAVPLFAFANECPVGTPQMQGGMPPPGHMMGRMPPIGMAPPPLQELARLKELNLSEAQQKEIFNLIYEQAPAIFENDRIAQRTMKELHESATSNKFDAARAKSLADEHSKAIAALIYMRTETESKIWATLTESQKKRMKEHTGPPPRH